MKDCNNCKHHYTGNGNCSVCLSTTDINGVRTSDQSQWESADVVNHPSHYETGKFECIDVMCEAVGVEAVKNFCICNAFKYIYRHKRKNGVEDIKKAKWYIDKFIELVEEEAKG